MVRCPLSTKIKSHPFEVLAEVAGVDWAALSDQVKLLIWKARRTTLNKILNHKTKRS